MEYPGRSIAWGRWTIVRDEEDGFGGQGSRDSGSARFEPAPGLDHANKEVRESLKDWLRWLHTDIGYSGWRLDYDKVSCSHSDSLHAQCMTSHSPTPAGASGPCAPVPLTFCRPVLRYPDSRIVHDDTFLQARP